VNHNLRATLLTLRELLFTTGPFVLLAALLLAGAYHWLQPNPPRTVVLATGVAQGAYAEFGKRYAAHLAQHGFTVELRATQGAAENLALLKIPLVGVVANRIGGAGGHYAYGGDYAAGYGADPDQQPVDELDGPPEPSGQRDRLARADQPQRRAA